MALVFNCSNCGKPISVRYVKVGEAACCRNCGATTVVPPDASTVTDAGLDPATQAGPIPQPTPATVTTPAKEPLTGTPRLIRNMIIAGLIQILLLVPWFDLAGTSIEVMGQRALILGNSQIWITPLDGVHYLDPSEAGGLLLDEGILFLLVAEPTDDDLLRFVVADYGIIGDHKNLSSLAASLTENTPDEIVSSEIVRNRLEMITCATDSSGVRSCSFSRIFRAFPYYLRLQVAFGDQPEPPAEILEMVDLVEVKRR